MATFATNERQRRILQLSQEWGIVLPPVRSQLSRPTQVPTFKTPADDQVAEDLLTRHLLEASKTRPKNGLSRAFSSNNLKRNKNWEPRDVLEVLASWVANAGSPGVAEALITKLTAAGVDLSGMQQQKNGLLSKRRSLETIVDRTQLLRSAVHGNQLHMVQILLPHADSLALDAALPHAIRNGNTQIVEYLLRYGATTTHSVEAQAAFRQACSFHGLSDMIGLIMQSDGRPPPSVVSDSMPDAARAGCLETVLHLSRSTADGNHNQAEALKLAIGIGRKDIALAIVMGNKPPQRPGLDDAFRLAFSHASWNPSLKLDMAELLLCAGAGGPFIPHALSLSCESQFYDMANLLASYGVSIEYNNAQVLKNAIARGQLDLATALLQEKANIPPAVASACVSSIPKQCSFEARHLLLELLLRKGASGETLSESLLTATEAGDAKCVELLLNPNFPYPNTNGQHQNGNSGPNHHGLRHAVASVDYRNGEALRTAVLRSDLHLTQLLLAGRPSSETLTVVFPLTKNLSTADRYRMVELFLKRSLSGDCLHLALQDALNQDSASRDGALIKLLMQNGADVNFNHGAALNSIIRQQDTGLLALLLKKITPQTAAARLKDAIRMPDCRARYDAISMLLQAGATIGAVEVSTALLDVVSEKPVDVALLQLFLHQGNANVNALDGSIVEKAVNNDNDAVLDLIFNVGKPSSDTVSKALKEISQLPSTQRKARKIASVLARPQKQSDLNDALVNEVQSIIKTTSEPPSLSSLELLLKAGANLNAHKAASLCHAVIAVHSQLIDLLFSASVHVPSQASLGLALPHALKISDPMDRLTLTKKLLESGAEELEVNRALIYAIATYPEDISLLGVLSSRADTSDGDAISLSVSKEAPAILNILLSKTKHTIQSRNAGLTNAMAIKNRNTRMAICKDFLSHGVSPDIASVALLTSSRDGDIELGNILMAHGANISSNNGKAVIEACRGGSVEILKMLLKGDVSVQKQTLEEGFQAATDVRDLNKRALVFEQLIKKGVRGVAIDSQLETAVRYGEEGQGIMKVLLAAGADPNYNSGEAVAAAVRSSFIRNLELLLGLWGEGKSQMPVSPLTLSRALQACWSLNRESRFQIIVILFKAGVPDAEDLHIALSNAVNEDDPEERLIKVLFDHGASPLVNNCKTLVDAAQKTLYSILALLLDKEIPPSMISLAFSQSFEASTFSTWFSEAGYETAEMLLAKGATGSALSQALIEVIKHSDSHNSELVERFVDILTAHDVDVNYKDGELLREAASKANINWVRQLLLCRPSTETLTMAFHCIFDTAVDQDEVLELFQIFSEYHDGDVRVDVMANYPGVEPVLARAISQYPRSPTILNTLLNAGYYHDQATFYKIHEEIEEPEEMTLLMWAISQPQKRVSSALIQILVERGAKVNTQTKVSASTPLMLAVKACRPDIVEMLLLEGADVDAMDFLGRTPLSSVANLSGDTGIRMMASLLEAKPSKDDGSLHNAARDLNLPVVQVLMGAGHDPDFPSPLHAGRSALGEVCLHGSDAAEMTPDRERKMQKVMAHLVDSGSDLSITANGKSVLHLCFEAHDPVATTRALLKTGMWKHINKPFNLYKEGNFVYSPTMYVQKVLRATDHKEQILSVLRASRATDVYYTKDGPQPDDAVGLPNDLETQERARKARTERLVEESQDFALALARRQQIASVDRQIQAHKVEMEDARRQKLHAEDLASIKTRAQLEEALAGDAHKRQLSQQRAVTEATLNRARAIATADLEAEEAKQTKALEWENKINAERAGNARALSTLRLGEREELERLDIASEQRIQRRLEAQRRLVESQERLAKRLGESGGGADYRKQIGYVTELN